MPCEHVEQPLSCGALEDTGAPAPMETMMVGLPEIFVYLPTARRARGYVAAPELPRAGSRSPSRGDTWWPWSCPSREWEPEPRGHMAALELPSAGRREPLS
jgi:hypothetical protein